MRSVYVYVPTVLMQMMTCRQEWRIGSTDLLDGDNSDNLHGALADFGGTRMNGRSPMMFNGQGAKAMVSKQQRVDIPTRLPPTIRTGTSTSDIIRA